MKQKQHRFEITVKTFRNKRSAELSILASFAKRQPDGNEFYLKRTPNKKDVLKGMAQ